MLVAKQVADLLTMMRASLFLVFAWLGMAYGPQGLPAAAWLLMLSWTSDVLDGPIARRSRLQYHTWLGDHDLEVDITASAGLLVYMLESNFVNWLLGGLYVIFWVWFFWRWGVQRSPGMLFQAPIYGWLIWISLLHATPIGIGILAWILAAVVITWPRFPKEIVPGFLNGMRAIKARRNKSG